MGYIYMKLKIVKVEFITLPKKCHRFSFAQFLRDLKETYQMVWSRDDRLIYIHPLSLFLSYIQIFLAFCEVYIRYIEQKHVKDGYK